jgi:hypothetical protein
MMEIACSECRAIAESAERDGKVGYVMCTKCIAAIAESTPADVSPEISNEDIADAVRAASSALPGGSLLIMVLVVADNGEGVQVHSGSNVKDEATRKKILETELGRYRS